MFFPSKTKAGFTVIEMMVVIAIMMIITGVVLSNFPVFRDKTSLDLMAQEVAITFRQAQEFSVGTRGYNLIQNSSSKFPSFGIYLPSFTSPATLANFYFYADNDKNDYYSSANDSKVEDYQFRSSITISGIYDSSGASLNGSNLSIVFRRPDPDARFYSGTTENSTTQYVKIQLSDTKGNSRYVCVWRTGHIFSYNPANVSNC